MSTTRFASDDDDREQHRDPHHDRVVARGDRGDVVLADPGDREDELDHERARDDEAEQRAGGRDGRDQRVPEHVQADDAPPAKPLRLRRADVVLLQRLEHRPADEPREVAPSARGRARTPGRILCSQPSSQPFVGNRFAFRAHEVDQQRRDQEARDRVADVREEHRRVVDAGVLRKAAITPSGIPTTTAKRNASRPELERLREVLLDDVVHGPVAQHERRAEVEREDALHVERVLDVPGLVEVELPLEVRLDLGRAPPARAGGTGCPRSAASAGTSARSRGACTGIVQSSRRMMNAVTSVVLPRFLPKTQAGRCRAPPACFESVEHLALLDRHLGQVDLVEQVDVERVLDRRPLEVRVRDVPVDGMIGSGAVLVRSASLRAACRSRTGRRCPACSSPWRPGRRSPCRRSSCCCSPSRTSRARGS